MLNMTAWTIEYPFRERHLLTMSTGATCLTRIGVSPCHMGDKRLANVEELLLSKVSFHVVNHPAGQNNIVLSIPFCGVFPIQTDRVVPRLQTHIKPAIETFPLLLNVKVFKPLHRDIKGELPFFGPPSCASKKISHAAMYIFTVSIRRTLRITFDAIRSDTRLASSSGTHNTKVRNRKFISTIYTDFHLCFKVKQAIVSNIATNGASLRLTFDGTHYLIPFFSANSRMAYSRTALSLMPICRANNFRRRLASSLRRIVVGCFFMFLPPYSTIVVHNVLHIRGEKREGAVFQTPSKQKWLLPYKEGLLGIAPRLCSPRVRMFSAILRAYSA